MDLNTALAPIVLFVYNRPEHTRKTLEALSNNTLAAESSLFIFCDGVADSASDENRKNNELVKEVIASKAWCGRVKIITSTLNKGLANSVISGVSQIIKEFGKVIVLEDDLITSTRFLEYMNTALTLYENENKVFQISGFGFNVPNIELGHNSFFLPLTSTWGWGTWSRIWNNADFECKDYDILKLDKELADKFNFEGSYDYKKMFIQQMEQKKVSSWGIRFYWNAFKNDGLVLYPDNSLVKNIGWDSSGRHKDDYEVYPMKNWNNSYFIKNYPFEISLDKSIINRTVKYIKIRTSIVTKIIYKIKLALGL
ncbi:sugar transferase [Sphingobacterium sp.]|uniref:sugar transferase n=1 Tax=Sphingobacterium sp. TaxID=341027 RepID=UPI00289A8557|nr:sugar transferase [Sphingobacterium sp.]